MEKKTEGQIQKEEGRSELSMRPVKAPKSISYGQLGGIVLALIAGVVITLICQNVTKSENISFSTVSLVTFLFSIALVGASIVLAITAIALGKASERAMIERSDESIRLQNEVFLKTTDALQRIESSTGVTEKRIEDMISGRAGIISQEVAERALSDKLVSGPTRKQLEEEIRRSIMKEFSTATKKIPKKFEDEQFKKFDEANMDYRKFQETILLGLANSTNLKAEKIGDGNYKSSKEGLVDGVFVSDGLKFAVSTFPTKEILKDGFLHGFSAFIERLIHEISQGTFAGVFLAFDDGLTEDSEFNKQFKQAKTLFREDIADKLFMVSGSPEEMIKHILVTIGKKSKGA